MVIPARHMSAYVAARAGGRPHPQPAARPVGLLPSSFRPHGHVSAPELSDQRRTNASTAPANGRDANRFRAPRRCRRLPARPGGCRARGSGGVGRSSARRAAAPAAVATAASTLVYGGLAALVAARQLSSTARRRRLTGASLFMLLSTVGNLATQSPAPTASDRALGANPNRRISRYTTQRDLTDDGDTSLPPWSLALPRFQPSTWELRLGDWPDPAVDFVWTPGAARHVRAAGGGRPDTLSTRAGRHAR